MVGLTFVWGVELPQLKLVPEVSVEVVLVIVLDVLVPQLDDAVCSPWNELSFGRFEGTGKTGQLLPCAACMKERQIGPEVGPPNPVEARESGCPVQTAVE